MYQLKPNQETFQVIDGPLAGTTYHRGEHYSKIPDTEKHRFKKVNPPAAPEQSPGKPAAKKPATKGEK
ncbi:MAG: hypothetical protein JEZ12_24060 [Desulfobacterium sp.]|nr:hypothetical protein [Desulfobacterium sp.]